MIGIVPRDAGSGPGSGSGPSELVAGAVAFMLVRYPERVPGAGLLHKAVLLGLGALLLLTVLIEMPAKLLSDVADPGHWLLVATVINAVRILALGVTIGLITRARRTRRDNHPPVRRREGQR